jgi:hypothetical protein
MYTKQTPRPPAIERQASGRITGANTSSLCADITRRGSVFVVFVLFCWFATQSAYGYSMLDTFSDGVIDPDAWLVQQVSGNVQMVEAAGQLKASSVAAAGSTDISLNQIIGGDFSVQVDYQWYSGTSSSTQDRTRAQLWIDSTTRNDHVALNHWRSGSPAAVT